LGKGSDDVFGIFLALLGAAALVKMLEKDCPSCYKKIARGLSQCPHCGAMIWLDSIQNSKFPKIGPNSLMIQGIVGLLALFLFMINSVWPEKFLPDTLYWGSFSYVLFSLTTMIILGIQQINKTTEKGKICHYCDGPIEISSYKCKICGKKQWVE